MHNFCEVFDYDDESGVLRWKECKNNGWKSGRIIGTVSRLGRDKKPYLTVTFKGKTYRAHRIIFNIKGVHVPENSVIDHIDGDGTNNRFSNLRIVTQSANNQNKKIGRNNKIGIYGVYFYKNRNKWRASIGIQNGNIFLGHYENFLDACCARKSAEIKLGYHENHGAVCYAS